MKTTLTRLATFAFALTLTACDQSGTNTNTTQNPAPAKPDSASTSAAADSVFHDLGFDAALKKAKSEDKVVMIDFYTTWCAPCKMLDNHTWKNGDVVKWLKNKTIALKIDAEKQRDLAKRYKIEGYPTMIFVDGDGKERGRLVGYLPPETFLAHAAKAIQ